MDRLAEEWLLAASPPVVIGWLKQAFAQAAG
jgi:hypothetical protein